MFCCRCGAKVEALAKCCTACGAAIVSSTGGRSISDVSRTDIQVTPLGMSRGTVLGSCAAVIILVTVIIGIAPPPAPKSEPVDSPVEVKSPPPRSKPEIKRFLLQTQPLNLWLETTSWRKDAFGTAMVADFTVHNPTEYRFKDFEITCTHSAPSGTVIDFNTETIYEIVEPRSVKRMPNVDMGFIHNQAVRSVCKMTDLVVLQ
jgi:hypothetical protein